MRDAHGERKDAETAVNRQRKRGEIPWAVADVLAGKGLKRSFAKSRMKYSLCLDICLMRFFWSIEST